MSASVPRDVQLTVRGRVLAALAAVLMIGGATTGLALYNVAARQGAQALALVRDGLTAPGYVSELWTKGDNRHRVGYRFVVDQREYGNRVRVSDTRRRSLTVGSPLDVRYLPSSPSVNDLGGARDRMPLAVPFLAGGTLMALGVLCLAAIDWQKRLLANGWVASAIVTGHTARRSSEGGTHRSMTYEFRLLSGAKASGQVPTGSNPPAVGQTVWIVYNPDLPSRSRPYPFPLVRSAI
jgi:hypothetical protein